MKLQTNQWEFQTSTSYTTSLWNPPIPTLPRLADREFHFRIQGCYIPGCERFIGIKPNLRITNDGDLVGIG